MFVIIVNIFLILLTIIVAPLVFLGVAPIYLLRLIVAKVATHFKKDFAKILPASSAIFAAGNIYNGRPSECIVAHCVFKGQFDLAQFRQLFTQRVISLRNPASTSDSDGKLQNPELQQLVVQWMGFLFWKWDAHFDIKRHIKLYESKVNKRFTVNDLAAFGESLICQPFSSGHSPWEIVLVNNVQIESESDAEEYCALLLHVHHCLLDGYSLLKLLVVDLGQNATTVQAKSHDPKTQLLQTTKKVVRAPHDIVSAAIDQADQLNGFHVPYLQLSFSSNAAVSEPISLARLKQLKNNLQNLTKKEVSLYALLLTAYAEGLRKFLLENEFKLPSKINVGISLPRENHPTKLRNHFTSCCIRIPSFDCNSSTVSILERLGTVEQNIRTQKESIIPDFVFMLVKLVGCLFPSMIRAVKRVNQASAALSNLPGPPTQVQVADKPMVHFWPTVGMPGNVGIGCVASTYNGNLRLAVRIDDSIVPAKKMAASKLVDNIIKEINNLELECA